MGLEWNDGGFEEFERQLNEQFSDGVKVPLDGSEVDAIRSVKEQLEAMGAEPNDLEVGKMVREVRESNRAD